MKHSAAERLTEAVGAPSDGPAVVFVPTDLAALSFRRRVGLLRGGLLNVRFTTLRRYLQESAPARPSKLEVCFAVREWLRESGHKSWNHLKMVREIASAVQELLDADPDDISQNSKLLIRSDIHLNDLFETIKTTVIPENGQQNGKLELNSAFEENLRYIFYGHPEALSKRELAALDWLRSQNRLIEIEQDQQDPLSDVLKRAELITANDAVLEVQAALSKAFSIADTGVPLHRIAVLYPRSTPYGSLVRAQMAQSGLASWGESLRAVRHGRCFHLTEALLDLAEASSCDQILERVFKAAKVAGGSKMLAEMRDSEATGTLSDFQRVLAGKSCHVILNHLDAQTQALSQVSSWEELLDWVKSSLEKLAPPVEVSEFVEQMTPAALLASRISSPSREDFRFALQVIGDQRVGPPESFDSGLFYGTLDQAEGLEFDAVIAMGFQEGVLPYRRREDLLLPEEVRAALGLRRRIRPEEELRRLLAETLGSAKTLVLTFARTEAGAPREALPSRFFMEAARCKTDREFSYGELASPAKSALAGTVTEAVSSQEDFFAHWRPISEAGNQAAELSLSEAARRAAELQLEDIEGLFGERQGLAPTAIEGRRFSVTALEKLFGCPLQFFFGSILKVSAAKPLEEKWQLPALTKGSLIHSALCWWAAGLQHWAELAPDRVPGLGEQFANLPKESQEIARSNYSSLPQDVKDAIDRADTPENLIEMLCDLVFEQAQNDALVIAGPAWNGQQAEIKSALRKFAAYEAEKLTGEFPRIPVFLEERFELKQEYLEWTITGQMDRADEEPDGTVWLTDYKSGGAPDPSKELLLQLPIYGEAASQMLGSKAGQDLASTARYVMPLTQELASAFDAIITRENLKDVLGLTDQMIRQGLFAPRPEVGKYGRCARCNFRLACPVTREEIWEGQKDTGLFAEYEYRQEEPDRRAKEKKESKKTASALAAAAKNEPSSGWAKGSVDPDLPDEAGSPAGELPDEAARERTRKQLGRHVFIEAGAGSGKTSLIIDRMFNCLTDWKGRFEPKSIAAITFTKKAAGELKIRLRERLEQEAKKSPELVEVLNSLDDLYIGTIHGFCLQILRRFPEQAGLPLLLEELDDTDEADQKQAFWQLVLHETRQEEGQADFEKYLESALEFGWLKDFAIKAFGFAPQCDLEGTPVSWSETDSRDECIRKLEEAAEDVAAHRCRLGRAAKLEAFVDRVIELSEGNICDLLQEDIPTIEVPKSVKDADSADAVALVGSLEEVVRCLDELRRCLAQPMLKRVLAMAIEYRAKLRAEGLVTYDDQILLAKRVLENKAAAAAICGDLKALFVDEFQDTDPVQAAMMQQILEIGKTILCLVGDPKQAIYRFRGADIQSYLQMKQYFQENLSSTANIETLDSNFRSNGAIIRWVNHSFQRIFSDRPGQISFTPLKPRRDTSGEEDIQPRVRILPPILGKANEAALEQSRRIVSAVLELCGTGRKYRLGDAAILLETRTHAPQLEKALKEKKVPYRLMMGGGLFDSQEAADLRAAVRALADPGDQVAEIAFLTSVFFSCTKAEAAAYKESPDPAGYAAQCMGQIEDWRKTVEDRSASETTELLMEKGAVRAAARGTLEAGDSLNRWNRLLDVAVDFDSQEGGSLADFAAHLDRLSEEESREKGTAAPEEDFDGVSVYTVHSAKGLEFPVTVCAEVCKESKKPSGCWMKIVNGRLEWFLGKKTKWLYSGSGSAAVDAETQEAEAESERLAYVAATRARDVLIVSLNGKKDTVAKKLAAMDFNGYEPRPAAVVGQKPDVPKKQFDFAGQQAKIRRTMGLRTAASSGLAHGFVSGEYESDDGWKLESEERPIRPAPGESIRFGRAFHAAMERHPMDGDLPDAEWHDIAKAVRVEHRVDELKQLSIRTWEKVRDLASDSQGLAREVYLSYAVGEGLLEGYIDLLIHRDDGSWDVVDYKTDRVSSASEISERMAHYRIQGGAYAAMLRGLGERVNSVAFLFAMAEKGTVQALTGKELEQAEEEALDLAKRNLAAG